MKIWRQTVEGMEFKVYFGISEVSWLCQATPGIVLLYTTWAAGWQDKDNFLNQLDVFITSVPASNCYVILGDFNARIGSRSDGKEDLWGVVLGPHGYEELNDAGRELLSFLSCYKVAVCNTWFEKKDVYKQTWQHLKSKKWNCIDFVVMNQCHQKFCVCEKGYLL